MSREASFTQATAQALCNLPGGIYILSEREYGLEIYDTRRLVERVNNPIRGRGIVRTFGPQHFGVTLKKAELLGASSV